MSKRRRKIQYFIIDCINNSNSAQKGINFLDNLVSFLYDEMERENLKKR